MKSQRCFLSFILFVLFFSTISMASAKDRGPVFKDKLSDLGAVKAGELFEVDLRTLLSKQGEYPLNWFASATLPHWLSLDSDNNRLSGTPEATDVGDFSFQLNVTDAAGSGSVNHDTKISVTAPPIWKYDEIDLGIQNEDVPWTHDLSDSIDNPAGGKLVFEAENLPEWMNLDRHQGILSGTPEREDVGIYDDISFIATGVGGSASVNAYGEVLKTITPPKWKSKEISLPENAYEDKSYSYDLSEYVINAENTAMDYEIVSQTLPTWLQIGTTSGTLFGTPFKANVGDTTVVVILKTEIDGKSFSDTASFKFKVIPVNHAPRWLANPLTLPNASTGYSYSQPLRNSVTDPDGDNLSLELIDGPAWLKLDPQTGKLSGTPANADVGENEWQIKATDSQGASATASIKILVIKSNEPPYWANKPTLLPEAKEDHNYHIDLSLGAYVIDPDSDSLTFTKISGPSWFDISHRGTLMGKPTAKDVGLHKFQVRVSDNISGADVTELQLLVAHTNHPPVWTINPIHLSATEDERLSENIARFATDPDNKDSLVFSAVQGSPWAQLSSDGTFTGTPAQSQVGSNKYVVRVSDDQGLMSDVEVIIVVKHINHKPYWVNDPVVLPSANERNLYSASLDGFAKDPDPNDILTFTLLSGPQWASVSQSGVVSGTPLRSHVGINFLKIRVKDASHDYTDTLVQVSVEKVNMAPRWRQNPILMETAFEDDSYQFNLSRFAVDDDGDELKFKIAAGSPSWMRISQNGIVSGIPDQPGSFKAYFEVTDGQSAPVHTQGTGEIIHRNHKPIVNTDILVFTLKERSELKVQLNQPPYVHDADGDTLNFTLEDNVSWLKLTSSGDLLLDHPTYKDIGSHVFGFKVDDGQVSTHGKMKIEVLRDPRPPIWNQDPVNMVASTNELFSASLVSSAMDLDGIALRFTKKAGPTWLKLTQEGVVSGTPTDSHLGQNIFIVETCNDKLCAEAGLIILVKPGMTFETTDLNEPVPGARLNHVWVLDNSRNSNYLVYIINRNIHYFYNALKEAGIHYSGIFLSSDAQKWEGYPIHLQNGPMLLHWSNADITGDFATRVSVSLSNGYCGNCYNSPFWSLYQFYEQAPDLSDIYRKQYFEAGVPMDVMILTRQRDHFKWFSKNIPELRDYSTNDYIDDFIDFHASEKQSYRVSTITPECPNLLETSGDSSSVAPADAYRMLVNATGGKSYPVDCNYEVTEPLKDYAKQVIFRANMLAKKRITLGRTPLETHTIKVWLDETELPGNLGESTDAWAYDKASNEIILFWPKVDLRNATPKSKLKIEYRIS